MIGLSLLGGAVIAHKSEAPKLPAAVLAKRSAHGMTRGVSWREAIDLTRVVREDGRLVQSLPDGSKIVFTLRPRLQRHAEEMLKQYKVPFAAAFLYDLRHGEVLAMAGYSDADSRLGAAELCLTPWAPAASVFKVVTAGALVGSGVKPTSTICYHGGLRGLDRSHLKPDPRRDKACASLSDAVARSINPVVGRLAVRHLSQQALLHWAERFGFNRPIAFELPTRPSRARIPADALGRAQTAAGFWRTEISPLHGAVIAGVVGSGGVLRWPHLVARVERPGGKRIVPRRSEVHRVLGKRTARQLARMMARTTTEGTARRGFMTGRGQPYLGAFRVAGKTGSLSRSDPPLYYSWFVGFAPVEQPRVALAVLLGNPPKWRIKASTAARLLLSHYLQDTRGGLLVSK